MGHPAALLLLAALLLACTPGAERAGRADPPGTCATVVLQKGTTLLVGHNLDESIPVPGLVIVNPRGTARTGLSYADLTSGSGRSDDGPRRSWVSRYGSVVYSTSGSEFIDGGMNEAGLYVGEMTLLGSEYPQDPSLVKMYHHAWLQYLLDNHATVPEALESLQRVVPEGHCQWHFAFVDREGRAALVQFEEGKTNVYTGDRLPVPVSTNFTYPSCLAKLGRFEGFGGDRKIDFAPPAGTKEDLRFVWAASMLRRLEADPGPATVDRAFEVLEQLWCGGNRWALVFDPRGLRVHWSTDQARTRRHLDFSAFDFSLRGQVLALDVNRELAGDTAAAFVPLDDAMNRQYVERYWAGVDAGLLGGVFWKPKIVRGMVRYQQTRGATGR